MRAQEPDLCEKHSARHRVHLIECRAALKRKAAAALGERPAPSLRDVCKRLGITVFFMNKSFPRCAGDRGAASPVRVLCDRAAS